MTVLQKTAIVLALLCLPSFAHASTTIVYVSQSGGAFSGGSACNGQSTISLATANTSSSWGSGSTQIGPGTTVYLCGTLTPASGAVGLNIQGSGTNGSPITIIMDTGAIIEAPYLGNADLYDFECSPASSCTAGIEDYGYNYIILDGGTNGIIQSTANGTSLANQQPSCGIYAHGDHIIIRNFTIQALYINGGANTGATDVNGWNSADIRVDGGSTNVAIYNNTLNSAHIGISTDTASTTGPANCPSPIGTIGVTTPSSVPAPSGNWGICIYNNNLSDHGWQDINGGQGTINVFSNQEGDIGSLPGWLNWQFPTSEYHQDGFFFVGDATYVLTTYFYNNYSHGDLGNSSSTGHVYCASTDAGGSSNSGCDLIAFNNIIVQTGSSQWPNDAENCQDFAVDLTDNSLVSGITLYNNTMIGAAFSIELYTSGGAPGGGAIPFVIENNIMIPSVPGTAGGYFINSSNGGTVMSGVTASGNDYYNPRSGGAWTYNSTLYSSLSTWQSACSCDTTGTITSNPNLNANYTPPSGSSAIGIGTNLTSLDLTALDSDAAGNARPSTGAWTAGAYGSTVTTSAPSPPSNVTATPH